MTQEEIREGIAYCDCGLTGGCEKCMPVTSEGITIITETIDELLAGAFIDGGLFYLDNRDGDKDTRAFVTERVLQLKRDLSAKGVVIKAEMELPNVTKGEFEEWCGSHFVKGCGKVQNMCDDYCRTLARIDKAGYPFIPVAVEPLMGG